MTIQGAILGALLISGAMNPQDPDKPPAKIIHAKGQFELTLPKGHVFKESEEETRYRFGRKIGPAAWEWLRVVVSVGGEPLPQEDLPTNPRLIPALTELPGHATLKNAPLPWRGVDILAAEYTYLDEAEDFEIFGYAAVVPLTPRAIMIDVRASREYANEVRKDLTSILAAIKGTSHWLTSEEQEKLKYLSWPGIAAIVLGTSYMIVWLLLFPKYPWRAHVLRILWLLAVGILFLSGFMLSLTFGDILEKGGRDAPFLCWAVVAIPGMLCFIGLAFRRVMLYIEG